MTPPKEEVFTPRDSSAFMLLKSKLSALHPTIAVTLSVDIPGTSLVHALENRRAGDLPPG